MSRLFIWHSVARGYASNDPALNSRNLSVAVDDQLTRKSSRSPAHSISFRSLQSAFRSSLQQLSNNSTTLSYTTHDFNLNRHDSVMASTADLKKGQVSNYTSCCHSDSTPGFPFRRVPPEICNSQFESESCQYIFFLARFRCSFLV